MGDSFTNILLVTLITLIGFIGKIFNDKMEKFGKKIEELLMSDIGAKKDVEQLKKDVDDHEERLVVVEKKIN